MAEFDLKLGEEKLTISYDPTPIVDAGENAIPCLVSKQTVSQFSTTSVDWVYSSQFAGLPYLAAADLGPVGTKWLVRYTASSGSEPRPFGVSIPHIELVSHRQAIIPTGYAGCEGYGLTTRTPEASRTTNLVGWFVFTADGYDLEFRMQTTSGVVVYFDGMELIAIPYSTVANPKALVESVDIKGAQGVPPNNPFLTTLPFETVFAYNSGPYTAGNWLIVASVHCKTDATNSIQARFVLDGVAQKTPTIRYSSDNRDITSFIYESVHSLSVGSHDMSIEGGSAGGGAFKRFQEARIYAICLNNFERVASLKNGADLVLASNQQYPNWTGFSMENSLTPFSTAGEFVLSIGNAISVCTIPDGVLSRIYNHTLATSIQEYTSYAQIRPTTGGIPPPDVMTLSSVGCELANAVTTYRLQHVGSNGAVASEITLSYRELILIGLYKKAAPVSGVSLVATDSAHTAEALPFGPLGALDVAHAVDLTSFVADSPPAGIPNMHPRLWLNDTVVVGGQPMKRLRHLRAQAGYDDNGNQVNPPGSAFWQSMLATLNSGQQYALWNWALRAIVTQDPAHISAALTKINTNDVCDSNLITYESNGLRMGVMVKQAAFFYDWLYPYLSPAQKKMLQDYMMGVAYAALKGDDAMWKPNIVWSRNDPYNNYFTSWHEIGVYMALALYHDVFPTNPNPTFDWPPGSGTGTRQFVLPLRFGQTSGPTYTDGYEYILDRLDLIAVPVWTLPDGVGSVAGGGWHEGSWYRPMWITYETFRLMIEVAQYSNPLINNINFRDYAYYIFHMMMPGSFRSVEFGDSGTSEKRKEVKGSERILMLLVCDKFKDEAIGRYAQYWLNNKFTSVRASDSGNHEFDGHDFFLYDPGVPEEPYGLSISKSYFSPSNQTMFSRSDWTDNATVFVFHSQDRQQLHEHGEENGVQIWSGLGGTNWDDRWIIGNRCAHGASGENHDGDWEAKQHNTHEIAGCQQRQCGDKNDPTDTLLMAHMDRRSIDPNGVYVYSQGNAWNAYRNDTPNFNNPGLPANSVCTTFLREYLTLPTHGFLFTYDRVVLRQNTPNGAPVPQTDVAHLHWTKPAPTVVGDIATGTVGTAKYYRKFMLPVGQTSTFIDEGTEGSGYSCVDEVINIPVSANYARLFTAIEVTTTASPGMTPMSPITTPTSLEGVTLDHGGVRYFVFFSKSQTGAEPPDPFSYDVLKSNTNDRHIIANVAIGQHYFVTETSLGGGNYRYALAKGAIGFMADSAGVVSFTPAEIGGQTGSFLNAADTVITHEVATFIAPAAFIASDTATTAEAKFFQTTGAVSFTASDSFTTAETKTVVGPVLAFNTFGTAEEVGFITDIIVPDNAWHEKIIDSGAGPIVPASDVSSNFFIPDPADGALFNKVADDNDDTFIFTAGPSAATANVIWTLTDIPTYIGRITEMQYLVRIIFAERSASLGAALQLAIDGLGLTVFSQTLRNMPFNSTLTTVELLSTPITCNITRQQMTEARLKLAMTGFNFGAAFQVRISKVAIIPLNTSSSEKVIN